MEHVFVADTNLFFECKPLGDIPWTDLAVDPVIIALTKPVLAEIEKHKNSSGRTRKRAIDVSKHVREMLKPNAPDVVIRKAGPHVVLRVLPIVKPDPDLASSLDYDTNDDRIVGTVSAIGKEGAFASVSMLTDDTFAATTAHSLGVPFFLIPESWKRPPKETTEARKIKELERDIAAYRAQEPVIQIANDPGKASVKDVVRRVALALESSEIEKLTEKLKKLHPPIEDFTSPESEMHSDGTEISYEAPANEAIEKYLSDAYPNWIETCRSIFASLHKDRIEHEDEVLLTFSVANNGTRPAKNMRVSFEALGNILLILDPQDPKDHDDEIEDAKQTAPPPIPRLPAPPVAPTFLPIVKRPPVASLSIDLADLKVFDTATKLSELTASRGLLSGAIPQSAALSSLQTMLGRNFGGKGVLQDVARLTGPYSEILRRAEKQEPLGGALNYPIRAATPRYNPIFNRPPMPKLEQHDPERFYYDRGRRNVPAKRCYLICDLFRHQRGATSFEIKVMFPGDGDVTGTVQCTVEAANLTKPVKLNIRVSRKVENYSLVEIAGEMVERSSR